MPRWVLSLLFFVSLNVHSQSTSQAKAECEYLLNEAMPFAEKMLEEHGEFYPFGNALNIEGKPVSVAAYDGRERPPSVDLIQLLREALGEGARAGKYVATALLYDVRLQAGPGEAKSDAIAVELDHEDGYSVVVFFPYRLEGGKLVIGEAVAQSGEGKVFAKLPRLTPPSSGQL